MFDLREYGTKEGPLHQPFTEMGRHSGGPTGDVLDLEGPDSGTPTLGTGRTVRSGPTDPLGPPPARYPPTFRIQRHNIGQPKRRTNQFSDP